ncbi:DUF72 domain-containing protein [bacterium]|nr:DUF72 domain-containing protein [bacterium]
MGRIYVGTAGWSYKDWYGIVYPAQPDKEFKELDYLARFFNTVEVNSTFYRSANSFMGAAWVRKTAHNPDFLFTLKVWQRFTHRREPYGADEVDLYLDGIRPVADAGKLGALLLQFPWSFKNGDRERQWLSGLFSAFSGFPLVVELRHGSWDVPATADFLAGHGAGLAAIDQPVIGNSIPPKPVLTGTVGYIRLHGRNYANWFPPKDGGDTGAAGPGARYDYLYSAAEIDEWAGKVKQIAEKAERTFVIQNNHPWGQAVANSLQMKAALGEDMITAPETLVEKYPDLRRIVSGV